VALLIGVELDKGSNLFESISAATEKLEGAYSFVLISILEPDNMYVFKNTGTMVIGISEGLQAGSHQIIESNAQVANAEESKTEQDDLFDHKKDG
jgi:glucosamine 6-phosphate synthetase-like amidotransferase/phosphosugar isomerase protein